MSTPEDPMTTTVTAFDWSEWQQWRCLRCGAWFQTRDLVPTCPRCGFREMPS